MEKTNFSMQGADLLATSLRFKSCLNTNISLKTLTVSISGTQSTKRAISEEGNIFLAKALAFKSLVMLDGFTLKIALLGKSSLILSTLTSELELLSESNGLFYI